MIRILLRRANRLLRLVRPGLPGWTASLYGRFALFITVMCCGLALVLGLLVHTSVTRQTVHQAQKEALAGLARATDAYVAGESIGKDARIDPAELPESLRRIVLSGRRGTQLGTYHGMPTMWAAGPADARVLAYALDYSAQERNSTALTRSIMGSSALAIALTLLIGFFAVSRITRRLHSTARVARRISAGDLDARVDDQRAGCPARSHDEVTVVSNALDTMAAALQSRLQVEQRFTADVAHELRTPLTGLHAAAELLPPSRPTQLVQDRVRALCRLTEDLLEISRLDADAERADLDACDLGPIAQRAVLASGLATEVTVLGEALVRTDRRRLERVLCNLIANAHKHGTAPVVLTVDGPTVTVRDHGGGYPAYLLEHGPQRFRTHTTRAGRSGHGLGLTIALGQARTLGATLTFANAPDGGALATLDLPTA
ncbi:ATP-binding protein [Streptomyces sp. NPDC056149]|uniref:ATP-binding protein n=1 Tax=Streptomyces sp. NPDC056149 TaxID=3345728 RepID=UPI0035DBD87C